jgi:hypothetical protein
MKARVAVFVDFSDTLVEKRASIHPISFQTFRPAAKWGISPDLFENVGQETFVPV